MFTKFLCSLWFALCHLSRKTLTGGKVSDMDDKKVIISFTTIPSRFSGIRTTLKSLLKQTRLPDEIVIAIPHFSIREEKEYTIPDFVRRYQWFCANAGLFVKTPEITVLKSEKDWGPATKFIPVLQREMENDNLLIVVDDDQVYQRTMVSNFIKHHRLHPDHILCNRGRKFESERIYRKSRIVIGPKVKGVTPVDIITGVGGYLLLPRLLTPALWDYSHAPKGAFYMDDIWLSGFLAQHDIQRAVIPAHSELLYRSKRDKNRGRIYRSNKSQKATPTLSDIPCEEATDNPREYYNNSVIEHYAAHW